MKSLPVLVRGVCLGSCLVVFVVTAPTLQETTKTNQTEQNTQTKQTCSNKQSNKEATTNNTRVITYVIIAFSCTLYTSLL